MSDLIKDLNRSFDRLRDKRAEWLPEWQSIFEQFLPYRPRWNLSDRGRALAKDSKVINSTPIKALRTQIAGLISSITSPSRIWFRLTASNPKLSEVNDVKVYLSECERVIREMLMRSRFYQHLAQAVYPDLSLIACGVMFEEAHPEGGLQFIESPPGEYCLDVNWHGDVDTLFREYRMTCRQMAQEFGVEKLSVPARRAYERGEYSTEFDVRHAVFPRSDWSPGRSDEVGKLYRSVRWETDSAVREPLSDRGYEDNPIIAPRWGARQGEPYGRGSPGWESYRDARGVQAAERTIIKLLDKAADPPLLADEALVRGRVSLVPGEVTFGRRNGPGMPVEPIQRIEAGQIQAARQQREDAESRIHAAFFTDLWLAMLMDERNQRPTATEVQERRNEIMIQLGPMLENLNTGLLEPAIVRSFSILERQGFFPDPPEELIGKDLTVEFISVLHQAQKMTGLAGIRELISNVGALAQVGKVDAVEKVNADKVVDELGEMLGLRPELIYSDDQVTTIRKARAEQQQAQMQGQAMLAASQGAKNISAADPQKISDIASMVAPVAGAAGGMTQQ